MPTLLALARGKIGPLDFLPHPLPESGRGLLFPEAAFNMSPISKSAPLRTEFFKNGPLFERAFPLSSQSRTRRLFFLSPKFCALIPRQTAGGFVHLLRRRAGTFSDRPSSFFVLAFNKLTPPPDVFPMQSS